MGSRRGEQPPRAVPGPVQGSQHPLSPPVENLRHLILCSLPPGHRPEAQPTGEPEDDLTPTPSLVSGTCHPAGPGSPRRAPAGGEGPEQEDAALCPLERLPPRARNSGVWESPELDRSPEEEASSTEAAGSYKVVRKGKVNRVVPTRRADQVEASLPDASSSRPRRGPRGR